MPTTLVPTSLSHTALVPLGPTAGADVTGNNFANGGTTFLYLKNVDGTATRTVTVAFARGVDGVLPNARSFTVPLSFEGFLRIGGVGDYGSVVLVTGSNSDLVVKVFQL